MANAEIADTQDAAVSQGLTWPTQSNQPIGQMVWGRLYGKALKLKSVDLCCETFSVGREKANNLCLTKDLIDEKHQVKISKVHFRISREQCDVLKPVYITDCSLNGTFVNGQLIGYGKKRILKTDDVISLAYEHWKAFAFVDFAITESINIPDDIRDRFFISKKLGCGAGGFVRLIYELRTCRQFAMKEVRKHALGDIVSLGNLNDPVRVMNEAKIMKDLQHPCIVKMHDIVEKTDSVYMILEYMKGGDLLTRIIDRKRLPERISKLFFYQMCIALKYLHEKGITHRDLKPENILLETNDEETLLKISDFGLSKLISNESALTTVCGTPLYVAPEVIVTGGRDGYTKKVDVWSLGVVLFTCLSGTLPFSDEYGSPAIDQIKSGNFRFSHSSWRNVSSIAKNLIVKMLTVNHNARPCIDYVLGHRWLQDSDTITKAHGMMKSQREPPNKRIRR